MVGKRGNNEGSIFKRADGRWVAAVTLPDGTRKRYYGKRRVDVAGRLSDALNAIEDGLPLLNEKLTLAEFLERWLEASASTSDRGLTGGTPNTSISTPFLCSVRCRLPF